MSQCDKCPIDEDKCSHKKAPNRHFDGVKNICTTDPREKEKAREKVFRDLQDEFEEQTKTWGPWVIIS